MLLPRVLIAMKVKKPQPNTEIILDVSASRNDQYLAHISDIYYVNDADDSHYVVTKKSGPKGISAKSIKVVSE